VNQRSGSIYEVFVKTSLRAPAPSLKPTLGYMYEVDSAVGTNIQSYTHKLDADVDWVLSRKVHVIANLGLSLTNFPNAQTSFNCTIWRGGVGARYYWTRAWSALLKLSDESESSTLAPLVYSQFTGTLGAQYAL
jgi:hypothetical protein